MNTRMNTSTTSSRIRKLVLLSITAGTALLISGCMSAGEHRAAVQDDTGDRVTAGKVQKEIHIGMSGGQVAEILGSPNIVSTDENRREVWIYDKISTSVTYSTSSGGISAMLFGGGSSVAGAAGPNVQAGAGASSQTQRTLTVVIKFDENKLVRDFSYHQSSF